MGGIALEGRAMPSWNIHMAQAERMLDMASPEELGIQDANAFMFGCLVPDIYVGYMVPDLERRIRYTETHLAFAEPIPTPRADEFWDRFVAGGHRLGEKPGDMVLGAWVHLEADRLWNASVRSYAEELGLKPGDELRIRKQRDFDAFGHTLSIYRRIEVTEELLSQAARFPQYRIDEDAVRRSVEVADGIADRNRLRPGAKPRYTLLTERFFQERFETTIRDAVEKLSSV